ncbi:hypothetical protein RJ640_016722 [Escallonia rubra]|uniref:GDT1 family protein n=1 Tax=Escallonia rubra TaxID=112253 RepID=A0AA88U9Z2_9ASTE|nr:hypothetical protein RJ640_016722 [Escallonia rubra]
MGKSGTKPRRRLVALLVLFAFLAVSRVSAQESANDTTDDDDSDGLIKDLGRRSKIVVERFNKNDQNSVVLDLSLDAGLGIFDAFFASLSMILVSEIGDETFIIAALMAMRHPKSIVLSGALSALFVMTILSTGLGRIVPNLISRKHTNSAATGISVCLLWSAVAIYCMEIGFKSIPEKRDGGKLYVFNVNTVGSGSLTVCPTMLIVLLLVEEKLEAGQGKTTVRRFFSRFCTPIFLESFILTFLAEWGDRSQIATIALATHKNAVGVALGATLGHTICTSVAVVGGSMLASRISQSTVATIGGLLFLGFSLSSYFYPPL